MYIILFPTTEVTTVVVYNAGALLFPNNTVLSEYTSNIGFDDELFIANRDPDRLSVTENNSPWDPLTVINGFAEPEPYMVNWSVPELEIRIFDAVTDVVVDILPVTPKLPVIRADPVYGNAGVLGTYDADNAVVAYEAVPNNDPVRLPLPTNEPLNIEPVTGWLNVMLCELNRAKLLLFASSTPLPITTNESVLLWVLYRPAANWYEPDAIVPRPSACEKSPNAVVSKPSACEPPPNAIVNEPSAWLYEPDAIVLTPSACEP